MQVPLRAAPAVLCLLAAVPALAQERPSLLPLPAEVHWTDEEFVLRPSARIVAGAAEEVQGRWLAAELAVATGWDLPVMSIGAVDEVGADILLAIFDGPEAHHPPAGYSLSVTSKQVVVIAADPAGLFHGLQTLRQLLPAAAAPGVEAIVVPGVRMEDEPRFEWRGVMLDCSRTFQSIEYLRKTIDRMALYKLNVLHLHLTDDQGWRVPIDAYPLLTEKGARFPERYDEPEAHHGFYTKGELRDLVRYAAERAVTIVPEIELPGHSVAALSCYPALSCTGGPFEIYPFFQGPGITKEIFCAGNDATFAFFEAVFDEVCAIFPSTFVHVGGDEVPKERWEACPKCQTRMREEGLADTHELQSWFIRRAETMLAERGRRLIGWDEILEGGLAPNATVMSWRGTSGGIAAARAGHDVVMSPTSHCYFDYTYDRIDSQRAYSFEPVPAELTAEEGRHVLGLQANFWSHIDREPELVDRQLFPRLLAIAERGWSPAHVRDGEDFRARLRDHLPRLAAMGVRYYALDGVAPAAEWTPATTPAAFAPVEWDVTDVVDAAGTWEVHFRYTRGAHRLEIEDAAFVVDGEEVVVDAHPGLAGAVHEGNVYVLPLPRRPIDAVVTLRIRARGGGGTDSAGVVRLVRRAR